MKITDDIIYVGVNDHDIDLFEGQYIVPNGMAYNSYVIKDEKTAVMDTVEANFAEEWLGNIDTALGGAAPDYLIVQHMEPDHSANIAKFTEKYPEAKVVANAKAFQMMSNFFRGMDLGDKKVEVKNQETLSLGKHELTFVFAPMVHWPEVMVTYDSTDKVLFSADAFGKFGALDVEEDWDCEARRYYFGIVGKYGKQAENLLKAAEGLDIQTICALHGPILKENLEHYIGQYKTWSSYGVETEGVMIAYTSVYGNTKKAAETLASALEAKGCPKVVLCDLAREGKTVERKARKIKILEITIDQIALPFVTMTVTCSKGTYIRTLCADIGKALGCGGHMAELLRTATGSFSLENAIKLDDLKALAEQERAEDALLTMQEALRDFPVIKIAEGSTKLLYNGGKIQEKYFTKQPKALQEDEIAAVYDFENHLVGLYTLKKEETNFYIKPFKMLV